MNTDKIFLLKLLNNDIIIGEHISETDYTIMIKNPMMLEELIDPDSGKQMSLLSSYTPFSVSNVLELSKPHILFLLDLHPELKRYYLNALEMSGKYIEKTLDEIRQVNETIEMLLEEDMSVETNDESLPEPIVNTKSSNTIH